VCHCILCNADLGGVFSCTRCPWERTLLMVVFVAAARQLHLPSVCALLCQQGRSLLSFYFYEALCYTYVCVTKQHMQCRSWWPSSCTRCRAGKIPSGGRTCSRCHAATPPSCISLPMRRLNCRWECADHHPAEESLTPARVACIEWCIQDCQPNEWYLLFHFAHGSMCQDGIGVTCHNL
jgi:hypothetical protein